MDCGVETVDVGGCHDYYMLRDEVWLKAVPKRRGMLCIPCVEGRLGRTLSHQDFADVPLMTIFASSMCSPRVIERYNRRP